jgi:signal transduction histidine kinase
VQLVFVILLVTCLAQVAWWVVDQGLYSGAMNAKLTRIYERNAEVAAVLAGEHDFTPGELEALFGTIEFDEEGHASVASGLLDMLRHRRQARLTRYYWEAGFFVLVLLSTVALIGVTLRARTELLKRQQNFLAAVSHELKSPLASLKLSAETLLLREPDKAGQRRIAERMVQSTERLAGMVTNLLDTARLDDDRVELTPERIELARLVEHAIAPIACSAHAHSVEIRAEIPAELEVFADPTAVQSVVSNLVSNAYKSTKAQGGGQVLLTAQREGARVRLQVADNGMGFEPRIAHQLFERFFRPGNELVRRTKGSGLGLFIVRRFVELDGGEIDAKSEGEGQGATFTVWWRAAHQKEATA